MENRKVVDGLVSIIMPSWNTDRFIAETIQSVLDQTYTNWELLIVDDCSTDNTDVVVSSFKDDRIQYFHNKKNSGAALTRNKALREARGEWIAFLDSDDLWSPEKLEHQLKFMKENDYSFSFGTVLALLLCVDRLNPKHVGNWIMLIAGTMTFSAAFIIIISFYLVLNSIKSVKILILVIIALIFYFYVLPNMTFNNPNINTLVQRITWVNGGFFGDNRSNNIIDEAFIELWKTKYILFGHGGGYCASLITGGVASIKTYVIDYGIMGVLVIYGTLIAYSIRKCHNNWQALSYVFVFILSIYQRPNIYSPIYFILLLYGIDYINNNYVLEEKRRII